MCLALSPLCVAEAEVCVPDLTFAPSKALTEKRCIGTIGNLNPARAPACGLTRMLHSEAPNCLLLLLWPSGRLLIVPLVNLCHCTSKKRLCNTQCRQALWPLNFVTSSAGRTRSLTFRPCCLRAPKSAVVPSRDALSVPESPSSEAMGMGFINCPELSAAPRPL